MTVKVERKNITGGIRETTPIQPLMVLTLPNRSKTTAAIAGERQRGQSENIAVKLESVAVVVQTATVTREVVKPLNDLFTKMVYYRTFRLINQLAK